jgi:hypothetical protein
VKRRTRETAQPDEEHPRDDLRDARHHNDCDVALDDFFNRDLHFLEGDNGEVCRGYPDSKPKDDPNDRKNSAAEKPNNREQRFAYIDKKYIFKLG